MPDTVRTVTVARCACGRVEFEAAGAPIVCAVCYCDDCQEGSRRIEALAGAPRVREADGGTAYILYRKDRVRCTQGAEFLMPLKIREKTATNRVVATCCNAAVLLNFDDGKHWVDLYRSRVVGEAPPVEMRVGTKFKPAGVHIPDDVPGYPTYPLGFVGKLIAAKIAMLFGR